MATMTLADYLVLSDGAFELPGGHVKRLKFDLPNNFFQGETILEGGATQKPVLMYGVTPLEDVRYIVLLNDVLADPNNIPQDKIVDSHELHGETFRTLHEAVPGDEFLAGASFENFFDFRVVEGRARFHDVVLFYQRVVPVPNE